MVPQERFKLLMVAGVNHSSSTYLPTTPGSNRKIPLRFRSLLFSHRAVFSARRRSYRAISVRQHLQLVPTSLFSRSPPCECLAISPSGSPPPLYSTLEGAISWFLAVALSCSIPISHNFPLRAADAGYGRPDRTCSLGSYESNDPHSHT